MLARLCELQLVGAPLRDVVRLSTTTELLKNLSIAVINALIGSIEIVLLEIVDLLQLNSLGRHGLCCKTIGNTIITKLLKLFGETLLVGSVTTLLGLVALCDKNLLTIEVESEVEIRNSIIESLPRFISLKWFGWTRLGEIVIVE